MAVLRQVLFTFKGLDENFDDKLTAEATCLRWWFLIEAQGRTEVLQVVCM